MSTSGAQILASNTIAHWKEPGFFRESNPEEEHSRWEMNLEYLVMTESVRTDWKKMMGADHKDIGASLKGFSRAKSGMIWVSN